MRCRAAFVITLALGVTGRSAHGQDVLRLAPQGNEIGAESRAERWGTNGSPRLRSLSLGEWVSLSFTGILVSPRLLTWTATLRPYFGQQTGSVATSENTLQNTGLSFGANVFSGFPISASLYSQRTAGQMSSATGGTSDFQTATNGASVLWRNEPLPISLALSRRSTEDAWQTSPTAPPLRRDESLVTTRLEARNSKLLLALEQIGFEDRLGSLDFASTSIVADHTLRWGRGSWLTSQLQSAERSGSFPYRRRGGGFRLHVLHTPVTTSELFADRRQGSTAGFAILQEGVGYELRNRTRDWLTLSGATSVNRSTHGVTGVATTRFGTRAEAARTMPRGFRLSVNVAANLERVDRELGSERWALVFAETHRVEPTRGFDLTHVGIDVASIQVRSVDQTTLYVENADYSVVATGPTVRIQILSGGRLTVGDVVLVDYRYAAVDAGRHRVMGLSGDLYLSSEAVSLWAGESVRVPHTYGTDSDARSLGGRDRLFGASVRRGVGRGRIVLEATQRSRTASAADVSSRDVRVTWTPATSGASRWALGARGATSEARGQRQTSVSTDATFARNVSASLQVQSGAEWWMWESDGTREYFLSTNGEVTWRFGQVDLNTRYVFQQRTHEVQSDQHRFILRLVRHF